MHTLLRITPLALAALAGTALAAPPAAADDNADVQALANQLEQLKSNYAQEVRRLRELDMQVQAMQARLGGRVGPASTPPAAPLAQAAAAAVPPSSEGYASTAAEAQQAKQESRRSVDDVKQQQSALFSRRFTIENSLTYARYDRKQLTLNGFLALDAIFLGNIAIENVESDSLTYNLAARWGVSPNLTLNLDVPYLARRTVYQKGGAGGAAGGADAQAGATGQDGSDDQPFEASNGGAGGDGADADGSHTSGGNGGDGADGVFGGHGGAGGNGQRHRCSRPQLPGDTEHRKRLGTQARERLPVRVGNRARRAAHRRQPVPGDVVDHKWFHLRVDEFTRRRAVPQSGAHRAGSGQPGAALPALTPLDLQRSGDLGLHRGPQAVP